MKGITTLAALPRAAGWASALPAEKNKNKREAEKQLTLGFERRRSSFVTATLIGSGGSGGSIGDKK